MFSRSTIAALVGISLAASLPSGFVAAEPPSQPPQRGQLTRPPRLLEFVEAPYPEEEAESQRSATVVLAIVIAADGTVEDVTVQQPASPAFDAAAVEAARRFVFEPAEIDGVAARIRILYNYQFTFRAPEPEAPTTAIYDGVIRDPNGAPLAGVTVALDDGASTTTDAEGRFHFESVAPGAHTVTLSGEHLTALQTEETFVAGERLEATYDVTLTEEAPEGEQGDDMEIVVAAPRLQRQAVATEVAAEEARRVPGTSGEVVQVVNNLPGVGRSAVGSGAFVVWGAAPEDTGVYVDGVRVPRLYHDGGLRSVTGSEFVRSVQLVPGGYGAAYGRGLGGLVLVTTQRADADPSPHATAQADIYDAQGSVRTRLGDRFSVSVAGRASYVAPLLRAVASSDIEDFYPLPHYYDGQARIGVRLRSNEWMDITTLISSDHIRRTVQSPDPARTTEEQRGLQFQRVYLRYGHELDDGATISAVLFAGATHQSLTSTFGDIETQQRADSVSFGLRASYRKRVVDWLTVESGLDSEVTRTDVVRQGSIAVPSREGDIRVFGQPPPDQVGADDYHTTFVNGAPYVQADIAAARERFQATLGLRLDPYARSISRINPPGTNGVPAIGRFAQDFRIEPRANVRWAPSDRGYVQAAVGLYGQQPQATDLSSVFGNPTLTPPRSQHYVLGGNIKITESLNAELTSFLTRSFDLAMRNQTDSPPVSQTLLADGRGRAYGAQLLIRLAPTSGVFGWVSYTLMRSDRRDAPGLAWRPFDYDQRHVLTALAGYTIGSSGFELGVRMRVATGVPRTQVIGAYYDARRELYQPLFGEHNGIRLPTFFQLDVRVAKTFHIHDTELSLYLEVQNLTNHHNAEEFIYNSDFTVRGTITGLPILPVLGLRWTL